MSTRPRVSILRVAMMTVLLLALVPATVVFGMYGFVVLMVCLVLVAFADANT